MKEKDNAVRKGGFKFGCKHVRQRKTEAEGRIKYVKITNYFLKLIYRQCGHFTWNRIIS